ncbi:unnamed protein product, partial [Mesorhabditis belari]|uniref:Ig-like domain-containing protein n=1 Tax=Mesorhabditis belari TaxID=2138241 RepID=A0AAF3FLS8_9BILA
MRDVQLEKSWIFLVLLILVGLSSGDDVKDSKEESDNKLRVDGSQFVVRARSKFVVSCVFAAEEISDLADIQWKTGKGKSIDGETSSSIFTIALVEHRTGHKKRNLHFSMIEQKDEGDYVCEAKDLDGKIHQRKINIKVLAPVDWTDTSKVVGGLVGEPLTIDCSARGSPPPSIQITDENGEPLNEELFTIAGNDVTVRSLSKDFDGKVVSCVALQILNDLDTTSTELRDVTIDVWHVPEFPAEKIDRYAITGRQAILPCNVTSSNPPPAHFFFFKDGKELKDSDEKYDLVVDVKEHSAALIIKSVTIDDLGEYRCDVNNRKATGSLEINLKEASPPDVVKATVEKTSRHSILWKIDCDEDEGELAVQRIDIDFVRRSLLKKGDPDNESDEYDDRGDEHIWKTQALNIRKNKSDNDLYEISGLRSDTDYSFRFRAVSEAGEGDLVEVEARTEGDEMLAAASSSLSIFLIPIFLIFQFL